MTMQEILGANIDALDNDCTAERIDKVLPIWMADETIWNMPYEQNKKRERLGVMLLRKIMEHSLRIAF